MVSSDFASAARGSVGHCANGDSSVLCILVLFIMDSLNVQNSPLSALEKVYV